MKKIVKASLRMSFRQKFSKNFFKSKTERTLSGDCIGSEMSTFVVFLQRPEQKRVDEKNLGATSVANVLRVIGLKKKL